MNRRSLGTPSLLEDTGGHLMPIFLTTYLTGLSVPFSFKEGGEWLPRAGELGGEDRREKGVRYHYSITHWRKGQVSRSCPSGRRPPSDGEGSAWHQCLTFMSSLGGILLLPILRETRKKFILLVVWLWCFLVDRT